MVEKSGTRPEKPNVILPGKVEKILPANAPGEREKAQIEIEGADTLYREIRIENKLVDEDGNHVRLKEGAEVDVTVAADHHSIEPNSRDRA